jgi:PIN domain nuclease of toxin-antitoxin system
MSSVTTILLDTHVAYWWATDSRRLSRDASLAITGADELAVSSITWFELATLVRAGRIEASSSLRSWLEDLAAEIRTVGIDPAIAETAASLPQSFSGDPADRIIYATAVERGWSLVTKDEKMRSHEHARKVTIW